MNGANGVSHLGASDAGTGAGTTTADGRLSAWQLNPNRAVVAYLDTAADHTAVGLAQIRPQAARAPARIDGPGADLAASSVEVVAAWGQSLPEGNAGEVLTPLLDDVVAGAGWSRADFAGNCAGVIVGVGPGPYTGTRVAVATGRAIAWASSAPVIGILTLDALAASLAHDPRNPQGEVIVFTDARRREIYWARYRWAAPPGQVGCFERVDGPAVSSPADVRSLSAGRPWWGSSGPRLADALAGLSQEHHPLTVVPTAVLPWAVSQWVSHGARMPAQPDLAAHGRDGRGLVHYGSTIFTPQPVYLRRPDARAPGQGNP